MQEYFNVSLEFDHDVFKETIEESLKLNNKGYVCVVDANVLTIAQKNEKFREILNNSMVNTCDGSSIAMLAGMIYKKDYRALNGPTIFANYIEKKYTQLLLGSNEKTSNEIKKILEDKGIDSNHLSVMPLPFKDVDDFDYVEISNYINTMKPQIIWVSLGAPKQEMFMAALLPYIDRGIMFGIGAAFNFYIGNIALPGAKIGALKFIWVSRVFSEPMKQLPRILPYIKLMPKLFFQEKRKLKNKIKK